MELKYKKLVELYPGRYTKDILKEQMFYGMTQHLRNSMRYLYKKPDTTYEELMMSAKEAEAEWIDNKVHVKSTVVSEDPGKKEREELKQRIEKLTESVKAANLQTKQASPQHKKSPRSPRTGQQNVNERGPEPQQQDLFTVTEDLYNVINVEDGEMWLVNVLWWKTWIGEG